MNNAIIVYLYVELWKQIQKRKHTHTHRKIPPDQKQNEWNKSKAKTHNSTQPTENKEKF